MPAHSEPSGPARPLRPTAALHVWVGTTDLDETGFLDHVEDDPADWDHLQVMWRPHGVPVRDLLDETTLGSEESADAIVRACAERGILTANAGVAHADPARSILDPAETYTGLVYLGRFES